MGPSHPIVCEKADPDRLTNILRDAGFTFDAVKARLGTQYRMWPPAGAGVIDGFWAFVQREQMAADIGARMLSPRQSGIHDAIARYFIRRGPRDRLDLLIWLFLLNEPIEISALTHIFRPGDLAAFEAMNLIRLESGVAICDLALFECAGLYVATDAMVKLPSGVNRVMPLLSDSFDFVASVTRKRKDLVLDLCTGSGVHGLVATRHSKHVVATDINPRALKFAAFNAWFNGIENIEFCQGDLFRAVGDRTFDLVFANPPYMPDGKTSPGDNLYCGGKTGDVLWSQIIQGLEKHLRPGGLCQMVHMAVQFGNESLVNKVQTLLGHLANSCDIVICSRPVAFRNEETKSATSVRYGITSIRRQREPASAAAIHVPVYPPLSFDISDLLAKLDQTASPQECVLIQRCYNVQANGSALRLTGAGRLMKAVDFAVLLLTPFWRIANKVFRLWSGAFRSRWL